LDRSTVEPADTIGGDACTDSGVLTGPESIGWARRRRRPGASLWIGAALVLIWLLTAALGPALAPYPYDGLNGAERLEAPSAAHPFGTDSLGRDQLSRILVGARIALQMAVAGAAIAAVVGSSLGLLAGYRGGWIDQLLSRAVEIWLAFPSLLLALLIVARLGPSLANTALALGIVGVPTFYRLARSGALCAREADYVTAARAVGASDLRILGRHVLPEVGPSLLVMVSMRLGMLILAGGGLSFIGLGAQPPEPEWGALLAMGRDYMGMAPWLALYPGLCITLTVVGLNLLGDGLRDWLDPRQAGS
jgi:ABC-type dipeptide/oligopeptide/nickel transport system permease subunit